MGEDRDCPLAALWAYLVILAVLALALVGVCKVVEVIAWLVRS